VQRDHRQGDQAGRPRPAQRGRLADHRSGHGLPGAREALQVRRLRAECGGHHPFGDGRVPPPDERQTGGPPPGARTAVVDASQTCRRSE